MKFRKDITDYLFTLFSNHKYKDLKIYEQNGFLYSPSYDYKNKNKIITFDSLYLCTYSEFVVLKKDIEKKFDLKFITKYDDVVCRCGESKLFSSRYGDYEIFLKCNKCGNEFSAYSG